MFDSLFGLPLAARFFIAASVVIGLAIAVLVVIQAVLIARLLVGTFLDGKGVVAQRGELVALGAVLLARASTWRGDRGREADVAEDQPPTGLADETLWSDDTPPEDRR